MYRSAPASRASPLTKGRGMTMATRTKRQLVRATGLMDDATFILHFNHRHSDSLAGMSHLPENASFETIQLYRAFHWRLHNTRVDYDHEHEEDPPELGVERAIECIAERGWRGWFEIAGFTGRFVAVFPDHYAVRVGTAIQRFKYIEEAAECLMQRSQPTKGSRKRSAR